MAFVSATNKSFTVKAYPGDNKTLLAFNFASKADATDLAGFTIQCQPPGVASYFLINDLLFPTPNNHAVFAGELPHSSANSPFQKYRWVHVTGQNHQGLTPAVGPYKYTVTPRYFDGSGNMLKLDGTLSASLTISVGPFKKGSLSLGFTRGYMQSQAFVNHFGSNTPVIPKNRTLQYATNAKAGTNNAGQAVTFDEIYEWMGATARVQVFDILNEVVNDTSLKLDIFAYDLNEPNIVTILLKLADQGRVRLILDNAQLHVTHIDSKTKKTVTPLEVPFSDEFGKKAPAALLRGKFGRYSHDKVLIVSKAGVPVKVLTGSTNFSVTGLYVNANHVLVFDDTTIAKKYFDVFEECWTDKCSKAAFAKNLLATAAFAPNAAGVPKMTINFSPHSSAYVTTLLGSMVTRINGEAGKPKGNVLFAVMEMDDTRGVNPVYTALNNIYKKGSLFSYGISDRPDGIALYQPATPQGVLVTGKPDSVQLPAPFNQVPSPPGHEIHNKFVVCGINGTDPVVFCGSSNLSNGGEQENGDNLLEIHDADVATAFAIEALALVDHYNFLDRYAKAKAKKAVSKPPAKKTTKVASKKAPSKKSVKKARTPKPVAKKPAVKRALTRKTATKRRAGTKVVARTR